MRLSDLPFPIRLLGRYAHWLHTRWPAGCVEKLPEVGPGGRTNLPGVRIVGDLTGIPLLKFSADSGARAVQELLQEPDFQALRHKDGKSETLDLAIVGGGVSGISAAIEARRAGLIFRLYEAVRPFATLKDFPTGKPIYSYPLEMTPAGELRFQATLKESLVAELEAQREAAGIEPLQARVERLERTGGEILLHLEKPHPPVRALRVVVAIGRSGNFRKLECPGEDLPKVFNRLHDPREFTGKQVLVVGGGDSALEASIALAQSGAQVTLSYRKPEFSRPKPDNLERLERLRADPEAQVTLEQPSSERVTTAMGPFMRPEGPPGSISLALPSTVGAIREREVLLRDGSGRERTLANDVVFSMIGREPPLDFFRRSGITIRGEWRARQWATFLVFLACCALLYHWKSFGPLKHWLKEAGYFPYNVAGLTSLVGLQAQDPANLLGTLLLSARDSAFWYSLLYTLCVCTFGVLRIRRRRTAYITRQTLVLMLIQVIPLFLLPFILLPLLGHNGLLGDRKVVGVLAPQTTRWWEERVARLPPAAAPIAESDRPAVKEFKIARRVAHARELRRMLAEAQAAGCWPRELAYWSHPGIDAVEGPVLKLSDGLLVPVERWRRQAELQLKERLVQVLDYDNPKTFWGRKAGWVCDSLCPPVTYEPHGREYWRASGLILAWPLFIWNVFSGQPMYTWLVLSVLQTFVLIPWLIHRYGKGAYCGWLCSCGALAETLGDTQRGKMPHGPFWNRMNLIGQAFLATALLLLVLRVSSWIWPDGPAGKAFALLLNGIPVLNYGYVVDLWWAGILGVGMYFHFSGRVWCRFACPLAALMHIYSRFSRFRIFADKKKCISCSVCTSVCHQGIDIMNFANKGLPMQDPQCVRCSACVHECPTGTLAFGRLGPSGEPVLDRLQASPVRLREAQSGMDGHPSPRPDNRKTLVGILILACGLALLPGCGGEAAPEPPRSVGPAEEAQSFLELEAPKRIAIEARPEFAEAWDRRRFSHQLFDALLRAHVNREGRVDYAGLRAKQSRLDEYLFRIQQTDPAGLASEDERYAFWINTYNALTLKVVVLTLPPDLSLWDRYSLGQVRDQAGETAWKATRFKVFAREVTLDTIENGILRPTWKDGRVHAAVNCASVGCPKLQPFAFDPENLQAQLDAAAADWASDPDQHRLEGRTLHTSQIFKWYAADFPGGAPGFLARRVKDPKLREELLSPETIETRYLDYSWALNRQGSPF